VDETLKDDGQRLVPLSDTTDGQVNEERIDSVCERHRCRRQLFPDGGQHRAGVWVVL